MACHVATSFDDFMDPPRCLTNYCRTISLGERFVIQNSLERKE